MRAALLTYYHPTPAENFQELADLNVPPRDRYCARWGHEHITYSGTFHDPTLNYAIQRLHYLLHQMAQRPHIEVFWVLGLSAMITNHGKNFVDFIRDDIDRHFWITRDVEKLNAGSFIVRNSARGAEWIRFVAEQAATVTDWWFEQGVMIRNHEDPRFQPIIRVLPQSTINSYDYSLYGPSVEVPGQWKHGDLVLCVPGTSLKDRLDLARSKRWQDSVVE